MKGLAIDDAAWSSRWRDHGLGGKAFLSVGLLALTLVLPVWPTSLTVAIAVTCLILGPAGTDVRVFRRACTAPLGFIVLSSIAVAVTVHVDPSLSIQVSETSLLRALEVAGRAAAGTLAVLLLSLTTPMTDLMSGLRRARVPAGCVEVASLMYRMLFVLLDTTRTVRRSQVARLGNVSVKQTIKSSADLMAVILIRSWDQARRLEQGLAGRGYTNQLTTLDDPPSTKRVFVAATVGLLLVVVTLTAIVRSAV
ncbi:cobalt ECF transporter T component CbiQ [Rhodococcus sp. YH3-3]|uniref:cobalt ECF transporter T component CbiQ n=1 Tax=Rhodococcus sp. YH3-3 TaxID=1803579 RepID=UPI0007DB1463|nr:cobalt ECF transporter T component CbiQ [Rhodococcus sp. YH3-3]